MSEEKMEKPEESKEKSEEVKTGTAEESDERKFGSAIEEKAEQENLKTLKQKLRKKETEVKLLKKEREEMKDQFLRKAADMENLRKRMEREKMEFYQYALAELLKDLLAILDNFERALDSQDQTNGKSFREGVELIYKQYQDILMKNGVIPIDSRNQKFDPNLHQAFLVEESDEVEEPEIIEELQKGYLLHNRLLRPALVKVVVPKKK